MMDYNKYISKEIEELEILISYIFFEMVCMIVKEGRK